ncbi:unnamed protein product, partial [Ilex paraguariensis]
MPKTKPYLFLKRRPDSPPSYPTQKHPSPTPQQPRSSRSGVAPLSTHSLHRHPLRGVSATVPLLLLSSSTVKDLQPSLQISEKVSVVHCFKQASVGAGGDAFGSDVVLWITFGTPGSDGDAFDSK